MGCHIVVLRQDHRGHANFRNGSGSAVAVPFCRQHARAWDAPVPLASTGSAYADTCRGPATSRPVSLRVLRASSGMLEGRLQNPWLKRASVSMGLHQAAEPSG